MEKIKSILWSIGMILLVMFAQLIITLLMFYDEKDDFVLSSTDSSIVLIISWIIILLIIWVLKNKIKDIGSLKPLPKNNMITLIILTVGMNIALNSFRGIIINAFADEVLLKTINEMTNSFFGGNIFIVVISIAIITPIGEEIIFRGLIYKKLISKFKPITTIMIQAILFTMFHLNPGQFMNAMILGILFGFIVCWTNSIYSTIIMHMIYNFLSIFISKPIMSINMSILFIFMIICIILIIKTLKSFKKQVFNV